MNLFAKLGRGLGWGAASTIAISLLQLVVTASLARLLAPEFFGLYAITTLLLRVVSFFGLVGLDITLIQKAKLSAEEAGSALAVALVGATLCTAIMWLAAPWAELWLIAPGLADVMRLLAWSFPLSAVIAVSQGLLRRGLRFRALALIELAAYAIGYGVCGLALAHYQASAWVLPLAFLAQLAVSAVLSITLVRRELCLRRHLPGWQHFAHIGSRYTLIGLLEFLSASADAFVVARFLGPAASGIYNRAQMLGSLAIEKPISLLTRVLFPVAAKLHAHDKTQQAQMLAAGFMLIGSYALPVSFGIALAAPDLVAVLLGPAWDAAVAPARWLALALGASFLAHLIGVSLDTLGISRAKLWLQAAGLVITLLAVIPLRHSGLVAIAMAVCVAEWLKLALLSLAVVRLLNMNGRELASSFALALTIALISALCIAATRWLLLVTIAPAWLGLLASVLAGALGLIIGYFLLRRRAAATVAGCWLVAHNPQLRRYLPSRQALA